MFKNGDLPEKWRDVPAAWAALHPPGEYTYMLWTDEQLRQLIADDYPWLLATYDAYPHDTQRWDASRFAILHKYGGVYADLDIQARAPCARTRHGHVHVLLLRACMCMCVVHVRVHGAHTVW